MTSNYEDEVCEIKMNNQILVQKGRKREKLL